MLFFSKVQAVTHDLGLFNEPLFIIIGQGTTKLSFVKVGGPKKLPYLPLIYLVALEMVRGQIFFGLPTLKVHSFAAP